jgi:HAD superfamily hydrolase (TIGR01490 family)
MEIFFTERGGASRGCAGQSRSGMSKFSSSDTKIGAFFDLDGTLTSGSSLEWNYFLALRTQKEIPAKNYWLWLAHASRLALKGIAQMSHANKMYLRGVASALRGSAPKFLPQAMQQMVWHARQGHFIAIISGSLEVLAKDAAKKITDEWGTRGMSNAIHVVATQLEERAGCWTGRIIGPARIGAAKAESVRSLAAELKLDLSRSYAYGNTASDIPMLAAVGRPATVNASPDLRDVARRKGWAQIVWQKECSGDQRAQETKRSGNKSITKAAEKLA